ncbi:helix-turn-helix domain-containing protein [Saccharopolyspora hattusasensis]|uniref:helix-turn-helix domain-containing protein n=1 Tax=Saccharopolyspora hattusasensis TaxID=1128679 RepID=UPI003D971CA5
MDPEFVAAVARAAQGEKINISRFCREHGVSRGVFHKYVARFRAEGAEGFTRRSTATLRKWLAKQPAPETLEALQHLLDLYRQEYNNRRHQGIDGQTPQQRYDATTKAAPTGGPAARSGITHRPVSTTGVLAFSGCSIVLGQAWAGHTTTIYWQGDRVTIVINGTVARQLTLDRSVRYQRLTNHNLSTT